MPFKRKEDSEVESENMMNQDDAATTTTVTNTSNTNSAETSPNSVNSKKQRAKVDKEINEICQQIYELLRNQHTSDGRLLCETFVRLPSKRTNPDYYSVIKHPIDFLRIQNKIKTEEYQKFDEFDDDICLIMSNAKQYYKKTSQEYKDAVELYELYQDKKKIIAEAFVERRNDETNPISAIVNRITRNKRIINTNRKPQQSVDNDDESVENEEKEVIRGRGRPRGRKSIKEDVNSSIEGTNDNNSNDDCKSNAAESIVEETVNVSKKKRSVESTNSTNELNENLVDYLEDYFDVICSCQDGSRYLANIFHLLPSHKQYPDYYELIKSPIDLKTIGKKILDSKYKSLEEMENDLILMVNNAKRYNDPKSQLYKDAAYLKKVITTARTDLEAAMKTNKVYGVKTREKKHKIVTEIASLEIENDGGTGNGGGDGDVADGDDDNDDTGDDDDDDDDDGDDSDDDNVKSGNVVTGNDSGDDSIATDDENTYWNLYMFIKNYRYGNQTLIDPFMKLPNKRFYPDYYEEIKKPIAVNYIRNNIRKSKYSNLKELYNDFELLFNNAMTYNIEGSAIYLNAKRLLNVAQTKYNELEPHHKLQLNSNNNDSTALSRSTIKSTKKNQFFSHKLQRLFKLLIDYCENGRNLSKFFMNLPSRDVQPDYYDVIKDPIDLEIINKNIENNVYKIESEMFNDCMRVFDNAKKYYKVGSQVFNDAEALQKYLQKRYEKYNKESDSLVSNSTLSSVVAGGVTSFKLSLSDNMLNIKPNPAYSNLDLKEKLLMLYNYISDFKEEGTKRELSLPFKFLPSKLDYPDYYNVIKKPIDMNKIHNKITNGYYNTCEEMILDFAQLFENACTYNEPGSQIYKDALDLQKLLFFKRLEVDCNSSDDYVNTSNNVNAFIQELLLNLFEATFNYQDNEGRKLSDSFLELFNKKYVNEASVIKHDELITFQTLKKNILMHLYKRLDVFQDDVFKMFDQVRKLFNKKSQIYKDSIDLQVFFINKRDELCKKGEILSSNAFAYKVTTFEEDDTYVADTNSKEEEILYDILRIDHLNKLKEDFKTSYTHKSAINVINNENTEFKLSVNDFVYIKKASENNDDAMIGCVLAIGEAIVEGENEKMEISDDKVKFDDTKHKLLVQFYLKPTDITGHKHKFIHNEVFKSDVYELIGLDRLYSTNNKLQKCYVISIKDYIAYNIEYESNGELDKQNVHLCESLYSTKEELFRKVKKWHTNLNTSQQTSTFTSSNISSSLMTTTTTSSSSSLAKLNSLTYDLEKIKFVPRTCPMLITRSFLNSNEINDIKCDIKAIVEKKKFNVLLTQSQTAAVQENENYLYYEQIVYKNVCYKLGDYVYVNKRLNEKNEFVSAVITQLPDDILDLKSNNLASIVRIDRLWRVKNTNDAQHEQQHQLVDENDYNGNNNSQVVFYIKGPVFLRPIDIPHEPTRLFYKNEVFKDSVREFTTSLDEIIGRCVVLSMKRYTSCRPTEISEQDSYVCDMKYVSQQKTLRKFTKGLKKFELSHKCFEDEVYFFKKELRLRKYLSPLLLNEKLLAYSLENNNSNYYNATNVSTKVANKTHDYHDDDDNSNSMMSGDHFNNMSLTGADGTLNNLNSSTCSSTFATPSKHGKSSSKANTSGLDFDHVKYKINAKTGKISKRRVKRSKKCAYNIFSKEFRKKLRDSKSSLSFVEMSREVGNRWKLLSDAEKAFYEQRAKEESIKEAAKMAEAASAEQKAKQLQQQQQQQSQQSQQSQIVQLQVPIQQQQQQQYHIQPTGQQHINQIFANQAGVIANALKQPVQQQTINPVVTNGLGSSTAPYNIINVTPSNSVQFNLNYGQNTAYIIKQSNQSAIQVDPNATIHLNEYLQRANQQPDQQQFIQQTQLHIQQQQQQQQQQLPPPPPPKPVFVSCPPKSNRALHSDAYMRYIENLRKNQDNSSSNRVIPTHNDWHSFLDIRPSHIKEANMTTVPPTGWIENIPTGDVFKHLLSLRYYLLNDAINIRRHEIDNNDCDEDEGHGNENVIELDGDAGETPMEQQSSEILSTATTVE